MSVSDPRSVGTTVASVTRRRRSSGAALALVAIAAATWGVARLTTADASTAGAADRSDDTTVSAASCVEAYSARRVGERSFAVDATVTSVDGEQATLQVNRWFRGAPSTSTGRETATVDLTALAETGDASSVSIADVRRGVRLLVSGEPASSRAGAPLLAWGCGFTRQWSAVEATAWGSP